MSIPDLQETIERARHDPDAFRQLYQAYLPRVFAYVAYRVVTREDAEDISADVFVQVVDSISRFQWRGEGSFTAWLFRIAHNAVVSHLRQHIRRVHFSLEELPDIASTIGQPESRVLDRERFLHLQQAISRLSARKQEIVTLRYFGGLRNQEIAAVLGLDERTVSAHLSRALSDLHTFIVDDIR